MESIARSAIKFHLFKERVIRHWADQLGIPSINIEETPEPSVSARFDPLLLKGDAKVSFWVNQRKFESKIFTPRSAVCEQSACDLGQLKPM